MKIYRVFRHWCPIPPINNAALIPAPAMNQTDALYPQSDSFVAQALLPKMIKRMSKQTMQPPKSHQPTLARAPW